MTNQSVKSIEVVNNNQVPASLIKNTLKLKEGSKFSTDALVADFNALKGTGYFEDVMLQPDFLWWWSKNSCRCYWKTKCC